MSKTTFPKTLQFYKFCAYGFLKNLQFFEPFLILFFREKSLTFLQIGILFSIREISTNVLEIPTGIIADTFGRRISMIFSFIAYILSFIIFYFFSRFSLFIIAMFFFSIGEAFRTGTHKAMILEYLTINDLRHYKVEYYGHTRSYSQIGLALAALIAAGLVYYTGGYKIVFLASTVPYIINLLLMLSYPATLDGDVGNEKLTLSSLKKRIRTTTEGFISIFKTRYTLKLLVNSSLFDGIFKTVKNYLQPIIKQYALIVPLVMFLDPDKKTALITGVIYCLIYILNSVAARNAHKLVKKVKSLPGAINFSYILGTLVIIGAGICIYYKLYIPAALLFLIMYVMQNTRRPLTVAIVSDQIKNSLMASGLSAESQLKTIFAALASPIAGFTADYLGVGPALIIMGIIPIIFLPVLYLKRVH